MPSKARFLFWLIFWNRVLPVDDLMRRGFHMANQCSMCCSYTEVNRLFKHCKVVLLIWSSFRSRFRRAWAVPPSMSSLLESWNSERVGDLSPRGKILWLAILAIVCWVIWRQRNAHIFGEKISSSLQLPNAALSHHFYWVSQILGFLDVKYSDWIFGWDKLNFS